LIRYNHNIHCKDADAAWVELYRLLSERPFLEPTRDGNVVGEIIGCSIVIDDPTRNICKNEIRQMPMRYAIGEMLWYLSGKKSIKGIKNYTSAWDRMSDNGETVNSNYGWCIKEKYGFDQWEYVKKLLMKDENSRQAIIHIKTADAKDSKDVNCTVSLQFLVREGKLHMVTYMRSNDLWMGFPYDVFQFTNMQVLMAM
jgi:thymidylate synthase